MQRSLFSCLGTEDSETVVYIAELSYTVIPGVVDVPSLLTSWVDSGPAIIVNSIQLQVDTTCPVVIDSLEPQSCSTTPPTPPTDTPTDPPTDVTVIAVVTCVILLLVVVTIVAAIVVAVVVFCRKQSKNKYVPTPHHHSIHTTGSCWLNIVYCSILCTEALLDLYCVYTVPGALWWYTYVYTPQCCFHLLLCRPNRPLSNPDEYEYMGSGSGGVALASMTDNPDFVTAKETVTGFSSGPEEDKEMDHTYEVLPFEANEEEVQGDTTHGGGGEAADDVAAEPMYL